MILKALIGMILSKFLPLLLEMGVSAFIEWVKKRFGISLTTPQVEEVLKQHNAKQRKLKAESKKALKECTGVACPSDTKV